MTKEGIIIMLVVMAAVLCLALAFFVASMSARKDGERDACEPPRPRITPPSDCDIYTFSLDSQLKAEEWRVLLNAGWSLVTCNTEQYTDYAGSFPEAPEFHRTRWHYVFRRTGGPAHEG